MPIRILHTPVEETLPASSHVTIGVFDGVHRGHQRLIRLMTEMAHAAERLSAVMTFDPHPAMVLSQRIVPTLSTVEERARFLDEIGVDLLVVLRFSVSVAQTPASEFVDMLCQDLRMAELWMGPDFALGREREGDVEHLRRVGQQRGFSVEVVPPLEWRGEIVSSSRVRAALAAGDLEEANGCLGRPYQVSGRVTRDASPEDVAVAELTIEVPVSRLLPAAGVYGCRASIPGRNLGHVVIDVPPTSPGAPHPSEVEIYMMGEDPPQEGQKMRVSFVERLGR